MIKLFVNVDHVATVREARKTFEPSPLTAAILAEKAGQVKEVRVATGDSVGNGDVIAIIE